MIYPVLVEKAAEVSQYMASLGYSVTGFCWERTFEQQDAEFAKGRTVPPLGKTVTRARGGLSWHNYGLAVDMVFKDQKGWSWAPTWPWEKMGRFAESIGLQWGNEMGPDKMESWDKPHLQLTGGLPIREALKIYTAHDKRLQPVWDEVNRRIMQGT